MLRTLFLGLFLIALVIPAIAIPVAPAQASAMVEGNCHSMPVSPNDDDAGHHQIDIRLHGCIGCIAPQSAQLATFAIIDLPFIVQQQTVSVLSGTARRPHVPPPRN